MCSLADNLEHISTNRSIPALRLGSLFTTLSSPVMLEKRSVNVFLFLAGYLSTFCSVPVLAARYFLDLSFGAILEVGNVKKMNVGLYTSALKI